MAVIDIFTFNGENDILKLHLGILYDYVDKFIIVEANKTFTGEKKPMYFFRDERFFKPFFGKISYWNLMDWDDPELWELAAKSPNTKGASHWKREFFIKENIQKALKDNHVQDDDMVVVGDVDEIIDPNVQFQSEKPVKAKLRVYTYQLNNRSTEEFYGPLIAQYKDIKGKCLNHMRSDKSLRSKEPYLGWHFTSMGGEDEVRRKLESSYDEGSYYTEDVKYSLGKNIQENKDFLGRNFSYSIDESEWPEYLKTNRNKFSHLCRN